MNFSVFSGPGLAKEQHTVTAKVEKCLLRLSVVAPGLGSEQSKRVVLNIFVLAILCVYTSSYKFIILRILDAVITVLSNIYYNNFAHVLYPTRKMSYHRCLHMFYIQYVLKASK